MTDYSPATGRHWDTDDEVMARAKVAMFQEVWESGGAAAYCDAMLSSLVPWLAEEIVRCGLEITGREPPIGNGPGSPLGNRERQALDLVAEGLTNRQIAERMGVGIGTASKYIGGVLRKLGVTDRHEAAAMR